MRCTQPDKGQSLDESRQGTRFLPEYVIRVRDIVAYTEMLKLYLFRPASSLCLDWIRDGSNSSFMKYSLVYSLSRTSRHTDSDSGIGRVKKYDELPRWQLTFSENIDVCSSHDGDPNTCLRASPRVNTTHRSNAISFHQIPFHGGRYSADLDSAVGRSGNVQGTTQCHVLDGRA